MCVYFPVKMSCLVKPAWLVSAFGPLSAKCVHGGWSLNVTCTYKHICIYTWTEKKTTTKKSQVSVCLSLLTVDLGMDGYMIHIHIIRLYPMYLDTSGILPDRLSLYITGEQIYVRRSSRNGIKGIHLRSNI